MPTPSVAGLVMRLRTVTCIKPTRHSLMARGGLKEAVGEVLGEIEQQ